MASGVSLRTKLVLFEFDVCDNTRKARVARPIIIGETFQNVVRSDVIREIFIRDEACMHVREIYFKSNRLTKIARRGKNISYIFYSQYFPIFITPMSRPRYVPRKVGRKPKTRITNRLFLYKSNWICSNFFIK